MRAGRCALRGKQVRLSELEETCMRNRPVWFCLSGSARIPRVGEGVSQSRTFRAALCHNPRSTFLEKPVSARRRNQHARCLRSPIRFAALLLFVPILCFGQEVSPTPPPPGEAEAEQVVVSATRFDIPLDQSPASVSVISSDDLRQKQIERVGDALREVPGLSVVQTGTAGQLTSVFLRGLPSQDMQVLLDGIPINQGLAGQFDFANLTTDDIDRIEVVRGPQ